MSTKRVKRTGEKKKPNIIKRLFTGRTKSKSKKSVATKGDKSTIGDDSDAYSQADVSVYENRTLNTAPESPERADFLLKGNNNDDVDADEECDDEVHALSSSSSNNNNNHPSLQLVLLLMDPSSRRFELLQLEFDSEKAKVSDIMAQIPVSVTEEAIRMQKYHGVVDAQATHMGGSARLADFCSKKEVLVALPQDVSVRDCVRLARPILSDEKVVSMLGASGFDISPWSKKDEEIKTTRAILPIAKVLTADKKKKKKAGGQTSIFPLIAILALLMIVLQAANNYITAPIQVGQPLAPGTWRSKCGLMGFLPSCTNSYLQVNDDGTAAIYDAHQQLDFRMVGSVCTSTATTTTKPDSCVEGLVLGEDGKISIGGKVVKKITYFDEASNLTPWPFAEAPKASIKRFNSVLSSETTFLSKQQRMRK